jgi:hypothetical protein
LQPDLTSQVHPGISIQQTKLGHILIIYPWYYRHALMFKYQGNKILHRE